ncbi:MAG TPA: hypothetical protein VGH42_03285 [Verrucomicrobiae bacterium]|jgi:hypothetical protein
MDAARHHTTDREIAGRKAREEMAKFKKTDPAVSTMTQEVLSGLYEQSIQGLDEHTQATRKSILKKFKETWSHGLDIQIVRNPNKQNRNGAC